MFWLPPLDLDLYLLFLLGPEPRVGEGEGDWRGLEEPEVEGFLNCGVAGVILHLSVRLRDT